jgi:hypothetical protein
MHSRLRTASAGLLFAAFVGASAPAAEAQLQWTSKDEKMSFKIGIFGQLMGEAADVAGTDDTANNLFLRRLRILMAFNLTEKLSIFLDTDSPNLGKANNAGVKDQGDIFIQDFVATYKFSQQFMLDGGLMLQEQTYNHNQSAATLLPVDYGPFSFVESGPTGSRTGRDYGLRSRGYLLDNHLEYRAGVYQGVRGPNASNDLRFVGRLMYSFFTPQVGLFYRGTSLGKTQTLSFGAAYDTQEDYETIGADFFWDQPMGDVGGLVLQGDYATIDGDSFLTAIPEQTNILFEGGFYIAPAKLQPYVQYASQDFDDEARIDEERLSAGIAFYVNGHNNNIKLQYTRIEPDGGDTRDQINLQWQIFQF